MHGVSSRLTGGGTARCLQTTEAGGLGEGWSDAFSEWTETTSAVPDYIMGQYVTNSAAGIRSHPYSTSVTINPYRYSTLKTQNEVHAIGEVWANILHNVLAALVASRGFDAAAKTMPASTAGNAVWLHLLIDSLALQPCNPTCETFLILDSFPCAERCHTQSSPPATPGFRRTRTGMRERTSASSGRRSRAAVSVSALRLIQTAPRSRPAANRAVAPTSKNGRTCVRFLG